MKGVFAVLRKPKKTWGSTDYLGSVVPGRGEKKLKSFLRMETRFEVKTEGEGKTLRSSGRKWRVGGRRSMVGKGGSYLMQEKEKYRIGKR